MAALAIREITLMPQHSEEFGELGFTQGDRDDLKKAGWLLELIRSKFEALEARLAKVEDGRAHQKDLDKLREDWVANHRELEDRVQTLMLKAAAAGGIISALAFLEPILIKLFWHS